VCGGGLLFLCRVLCAPPLVLFMSLVVEGGGLIWLFLPVGLGFESSSWACYVGCIVSSYVIDYLQHI
jgi:hypothetical protein